MIGQPDFSRNDCNSGGISRVSLCGGGNLHSGLVVDGQGNLFVSDSANFRILQYDSPFETDTLADRVLGQPGFTSGDGFRCPALDGLCGPGQLALDAAGNLWVADTQRVLVFERPLQGDLLADRLFAPTADCAYEQPCAEVVGGVAVDGAGNLFVSDPARGNILIFLSALTTDGVPDGEIGHFDPSAPRDSCQTPPTRGHLCNPTQLAFGADGTLFVVDPGDHRVLAFSAPLAPGTQADGVLGAGGGTFTSRANSCLGRPVDGAIFCVPSGLAVDGAGNVFVADTGNNRVLRFDREALALPRVARSVLGQPDFAWNGANGLDRRSLAAPLAVAIDPHPNARHLYVLDAVNNRVLGWRDAEAFGSGQPADLWIGQPDPFSWRCNNTPDGTPSAASLCLAAATHPPRGGLAVDRQGNLYVSDTLNQRVLQYDTPFSRDRVADRVYGQASFTSNVCNQGGLGAGSLCRPTVLALDGAGNLYIADGENHRVVVYNGPLRETRRADRVIGQRSFVSRQCLPAIGRTGFCSPAGVAVGAAGELWVSDSEHNRVLRFPAPLSAGSRADFVLGQAGSFNLGDCQRLAGQAEALCDPAGLAFDRQGNLWVADLHHDRVVRFDRLAPRPRVEVVGRVLGTEEYELGFPATASMLESPSGVAVSGAGDVFVVDQGLNRVMVFEKP